MAKPKRSAADLDAELAALEAELAALEQRKGKPAPKPEPTPAPAAPAPAPEAPKEAPAEEAPAAKEKKPRFGLKLPKREKAAPAPEPAPKAEPRVEPSRAAPQPTREPLPELDGSLWRQEDGGWVRTVPGTSVVLRRVLDEEGSLVREEAASPRDLEEETPAKAERGMSRFLRRKDK